MPPTLLARDIRRQMDHCILTLATDPALPAGRPDVYLSLYWISMTTECGPTPLASPARPVCGLAASGVFPPTLPRAPLATPRGSSALAHAG